MKFATVFDLPGDAGADTPNCLYPPRGRRGGYTQLFVSARFFSKVLIRAAEQTFHGASRLHAENKKGLKTKIVLGGSR